MSDNAGKAQTGMPARHVFIVTYGRSGSTLLQNLLNSLPGYRIRGENNNALFHIARAWHAIDSAPPMRGMRAAGEVSDQTHPWYGAEAVDPQALGAALARTFSAEVLRPDPEVTVSGFKEIRFHLQPAFFPTYLDFIRRFFPGSRFVINTRDHAAVARSGWFARRPAAEVDATLTRADTLFEAYRAAHPEICHHVHYDDYVAEPERLRGLFDFLGEAWDADVVARVMNTRLDHARGRDPG